MSDNIPFDIQTEIIQRIPDTKTVIRYRSVSKAWKSVIDSKEFVAAHALRYQARPHLLIRKRDCSDGRVKYVSIVDDDTFPNQKVSVFVPDLVNKFSHNSEIVGSCFGLFCLYDDKTSTAVIWNPAIRKTFASKVPKVSREWYYTTTIGFGVCPQNLDPKLVKIAYAYDLSRLHDLNASTQVEVFTLSSGGTWRSPLCSNLPHKSIRFGFSQAVVDGFIYWDAVDRTNVVLIIMSFDLTSEEFTKVNLPNRLALYPYADLYASNLRESLVVLELDMYTQREFCDVWMMIGHGSTRSFNKLYSIKTPDASIRTTLGFRKNGAPIIELENVNEDFLNDENELFIYEPESENIAHIGIHGLRGKFFVHSYKETLLLLGQ
uniref:putative F-box protein At1g47730 n=1 Tax=Erigeron canadensis TaxID=72917 RepID=UPI001CB955FC|nr:putative F-box protein At1g47730 [Erigeron canadensis]